MELRFQAGLLGWIMLINIRRWKRKMKRKQSRKGRPVVFVELSKEGSVPVELAVNFLMMSK